jgi:hypothetical protein
MKLSAVLFVCLSCAYSQNKNANESRAVTVTGCICPGVECLRLKDSKGKQDSSMVRTDQLQVGHAYRIKGVVNDLGFCQEGKPILGPEKIIELKRQCKPEPSGEEKR